MGPVRTFLDLHIVDGSEVISEPLGGPADVFRCGDLPNRRGRELGRLESQWG